MRTDHNIRYVPHDEIDNAKWDECITEANNGLIYGYSFYLDHMARHWDALVLNDYEAIMPLTWNKKFGIYYLYQPPFSASLGIFGLRRDLNDDILGEFIQAIPKKFKLIEISLNYGNLPGQQLPHVFPSTNYVLALNKVYNHLYQGYRENHRRNIQKSIHEGNVVKKNIPVNDVIDVNKQQMHKIATVTEDDYERFRKVHQLLSGQNKAATYGVYSDRGELLSSCVFFFSHNRAYYILVGNHRHSRANGASHALIDAFIKERAGKDLILDFEGSDIETLALFYNGFGAVKENYPIVRWNRLPWWMRWTKR